jgi:hypothetical protein
MSAECEHAFSAAGRMITEERDNLKNDIVEADQCVKSWIKSNVTDGQAIFTTTADLDEEIIDITGL